MSLPRQRGRKTVAHRVNRRRDIDIPAHGVDAGRGLTDAGVVDIAQGCQKCGIQHSVGCVAA